ncbi:MAG: hypothetical protein EBR98_03535 [Chitinophagaceae bacterium]|nr:hypothetical protein [Chitinophagaceae bacterium]
MNRMVRICINPVYWIKEQVREKELFDGLIRLRQLKRQRLENHGESRKTPLLFEARRAEAACA